MLLSALRFQHTAARRRLVSIIQVVVLVLPFQHTAARRRLVCPPFSWTRRLPEFQHTAARRRLAGAKIISINAVEFQHTAARRRLGHRQDCISAFRGFNTQPPEGGWMDRLTTVDRGVVFQHTAARRRLASCRRNLATPTGLFQHTAARRRLDSTNDHPQTPSRFQHTAARRRLGVWRRECAQSCIVSTHSRPKAAGLASEDVAVAIGVSTHSRPKAAGCQIIINIFIKDGFNTQPPEGGWVVFGYTLGGDIAFQHTAARRRLGQPVVRRFMKHAVSTHSRPKAAGQSKKQCASAMRNVSTHSRPKAAGFLAVDSSTNSFGFNTQPPEGGWFHFRGVPSIHLRFQHTAARRRLEETNHASASAGLVSTHSRPKAAGHVDAGIDERVLLFQHTAARRRLDDIPPHHERTSQFQHTAARRRLAHGIDPNGATLWFQHTAARRRLVISYPFSISPLTVSTHSRPKAAGRYRAIVSDWYPCFNTQPPEGGWYPINLRGNQNACFNTQPPEGGWPCGTASCITITLFQHTAARRRLAQL